MQFRDFAENVLGSRVKVKLLRYLLKEGTVTSERELAKLIGVSHGAVNKTFKEFHESNLVTPLRLGNVIAWQLNKDSFAYFFLNKIEFSPLDYLSQAIKQSLEHLGAIKKVVIYGSFAERRELPDSDIDIFIVVGNEGQKKSILPAVADLDKNCVRSFGNKISPNIFTENDLKSKKHERFLENVNKGIVVFER